MITEGILDHQEEGDNQIKDKTIIRSHEFASPLVLSKLFDI